MQYAGSTLTVGELGESGVLARVLAHYDVASSATVGPGDDAAVLEVQGDLVVTSDMMVEGPDFRLAWHDAYELGRKLAATNLSDVAAMGARPTALTVAVACPLDTEVYLLEEIARGLSDACAELAPGCGVVGGDLSRAPVLTVAVTAMGALEGRAPVLRSGAKVGDVAAYAGQLGLAGLGLTLLFREAADGDGVALSDEVAALRERHPEALMAQFAPRPPIHLAIEAVGAGVTAMMDVSDGLALDAERLARASDVVIAFDSEQLIAGFGVQGTQVVPVDAMLQGGEDHGLLATFAPDAVLPAGFVVIGTVVAHDGQSGVEGAGGARVLLDGSAYAPHGWDPYGMRPSGS